MLEYSLQKKVSQATDLLLKRQPVLIAVSGGIDSRVLAEVAKRAKLNFAGLFFAGPQVTPAERKFAYQVLADLHKPFYVLQDSPLKDRDYVFDKTGRCYFCKRYLFSQAWKVALRHGYSSVAEGSNASDRLAYRPGKKALYELKVDSPLDFAGFKKQEIRQLARQWKLIFPDQPARPCLLTRFPYGYRADARELYRLGKAEDSLAQLGFSEYRLRCLKKDYLFLQIDIREKSWWLKRETQVCSRLNELGFIISKVSFSRNISGFFDSQPHEGQSYE